jgi:hypothetical protein
MHVRLSFVEPMKLNARRRLPDGIKKGRPSLHGYGCFAQRDMTG